MAGYDQFIRIRAKYQAHATHFFRYLQTVGKKYPVSFTYKTLKPGKYYIVIDGTPGSTIDTFFQELFLYRAIYYYRCSLNKKHVITEYVVAPILKQLLRERFSNDYSRYLKHHLLGKGLPNRFQPGDFCEPDAHGYEILFRRWVLGLLTDRECIIEIDAFLTQYMLKKLKLPRDKKSPKFGNMLAMMNTKSLLDKDASKAFSKIHYFRTGLLHRRGLPPPKRELFLVAQSLFWFFEARDDNM